MSVNHIFAKKSLVVKQIIKVVFVLGFVGLVLSVGSLEAGYEVVKTVWLKWWMKILVVGLWWLALTDPQQLNIKFFSKKINILLGLLLIVVLLSSALGVNWQQSLWGNYYRGDGLITWAHLLVSGLLVSWLFIQKELRRLLPLAVGLATLLLIGGLFFQLPVDWLAIGFGNSNIDAGLLVVGVPLIMFWLRKFHWSLRGMLFLATLAVVIHLQAWGGVIGLGLFLVMSWWLREKSRRQWVVVFPLVALIVGVIGVLIWKPMDNSNFTESRSRLIHKLVRAVGQRPLFGWGWANVDVAFESIDWPVSVDNDIYVDKAHSELLEIAVVSGIVGLTIYLLFLGLIYFEVINSKRLDEKWGRTLFLVCLLYFFHSQTNVVSIVESLLFWMSLGLLLRFGELKG